MATDQAFSLRRTRLAIVVIVLVGICTGCRVDVDINLTIDKKGAGTIEIVAEADQQVLQQAPNLAADLRFADAVAAGWTVQVPTPTATGGLQVSLSRNFDSVEQATSILASLNGPDGPLRALTITRTKTQALTTLSLDGLLLLTGDLSAFADADLLSVVGATPYADEIVSRQLQPADAVSITFHAKLPGATKSSTGVVVDDQLTWTVPLSGTGAAVTTRTELSESGNKWASPLAKIAFGALVLWSALAVLFIFYVVLARRRRLLERNGRLR